MSRKLIFCLAFAALVSTAWGYGISFVNANSNNTTSDVNSIWWNTATADGTPEWRYRTPFGAPEGWVLKDANPQTPDGDVYQTLDSWGDSGGIDYYRLHTTLDGLDDTKMYNVYVFFWMDEAGSPWRIRAALSEADVMLDEHLYIGGQTGPGNITTVAHDSANRLMLRAFLGTVSGVTEQQIWIDDEVTTNSNERVWYDGVGYMEVPEPMTIALLGLGGLLLKRRKR